MIKQTRRSFLAQSSAFCAGIGMVPSLASSALAAEFKPKYAICNETFGKWEFAKAFALAAECGYTGIEIAPFTVANDVSTIPAKKRAEIRKQAEKAGLEVVGLHWLLSRTKGIHLTSPDRDVRKKTTKYLGELARFCADLGGKLLVFGSPQQRNLAEGVSKDEGLKYAAEVFGEAMPLLEKTDTRLALEPLSPKITNFMSTAGEAVEVIKQVDSDRCQLILDCLAMATESTPIPESIRKHKQHLVHFHANDPNRRGPGMGKLDFLPIFAALHEIEFRGWLSVEVFDYSPGPEKLARESINYMRKCAAATKS